MASKSRYLISSRRKGLLSQSMTPPNHCCWKPHTTLLTSIKSCYTHDFEMSYAWKTMVLGICPNKVKNLKSAITWEKFIICATIFFHVNLLNDTLLTSHKPLHEHEFKTSYIRKSVFLWLCPNMVKTLNKL